MSDSSNACAICLEPLSCSSIGASVPCGHCFHIDCFSNWKNSKRSRQSTKCPTCNKISDNFCRIFVDLEQIHNPGNEDIDNLSCLDDDEDQELLLSLEINASSNIEAGLGETDIVSPTDPPGTENLLQRQETLQIRCIQASETRITSNQDENESKCFSKVAKRYKQQARLYAARCKQLVVDNRSLSVMIEKLRTEVTEISEKIIEAESNRKSLERANEVLQLSNVRLTNDLKNCKDEEKRLANELKTSTVNLQIMEESFQREVERARAAGMTEIKSILKDNSKLSIENLMLKEKLHSVRAKVNEMKKVAESTHNPFDTINAPKRPLDQRNCTITGTKRSAKTMLRSLDEKCTPVSRIQLTSNVTNVRESVRVQPIASSHAARISRAAQHQVRSHPSTLDMLNDFGMKPSMTHHVSTTLSRKHNPIGPLVHNTNPSATNHDALYHGSMFSKKSDRRASHQKRY